MRADDRRGGASMLRSLRRTVNVKGIAFILVVIGAAELLVRAHALGDYVAPPTDVAPAIVSGLGSLAPAIGTTLTAYAIGLLVATALGVALGTLKGLSRASDRAT
jgi:ABC-type nitrate/sulfonate/bicarbonate transport system permease component